MSQIDQDELQLKDEENEEWVKAWKNAIHERTILHLILKAKYFNAIERGDKTIEYRDNTPYWQRRIMGKEIVVFHRGYTKNTITFRIKKVRGLFLNHTQIEIHLGERLK